MRNGDSLARAMSHEGKTAQRERKSKRERAGKSKVMKNFRPKISRSDESSPAAGPINNQVSCNSSFLDQEKAAKSFCERGLIYAENCSDFSVL